MTVRDFLKVVSFSKPIFIKPNGNRLYFDGKTDDVPECLMDAEIAEIVPQVYKSDAYDNNKYHGGFGVWVNSISVFDLMCDAFDDLGSFTSEEIDGAYGLVLFDFEKREKEIKENIVRDRKKRFELFYSDSEKKWETIKEGQKKRESERAYKEISDEIGRFLEVEDE